MRTLTIDDNWKDWKFGDTDAVMTFTALDDDQVPDFTNRTLTFKIADTATNDLEHPKDFAATATGYVQDKNVILKTEDVKQLTPGNYIVELWAMSNDTQKDAIYPSKGFAQFTIEENSMKVSDVTNIPSITINAFWNAVMQKVGALTKGAKGDPGKTPKIVIGSVTKLAPNAQPSATLVPLQSDPNTYTLNLQLPQGMQGEQGVPGVGSKGLDGTNGLTPTIDPKTKHWMIGGADTGVIAEGQAGKDADPSKYVTIASFNQLQQKDAQQDAILAQKAGKFELEDKLAQMNLQPEMYADLNAVNAAYPNGTTKFIATDDGYLALYRNNQWIKGPIFQAAGIPDGSISDAKLQTVSVNRLRMNDIDFSKLKAFNGAKINVNGDYITIGVDGTDGGVFLPIKVGKANRTFISLRIVSVVNGGLTLQPQIYNADASYKVGHQLYSYQYKEGLTAFFDMETADDQLMLMFAIHGKGQVTIQIQANGLSSGFLDFQDVLRRVSYADELKTSHDNDIKLWNTNASPDSSKNLLYRDNKVVRFEQKVTGDFGILYLVDVDTTQKQYLNLKYRAKGNCDVYLVGDKMMKIASLNTDGALHVLRYATNLGYLQSNGVNNVRNILIATHGENSKFEIYSFNFSSLNGDTSIARTIDNISDQVGSNDLTRIGSLDHLSDKLAHDGITYASDSLTVGKDNQVIRTIEIQAKKDSNVTFVVGTIDQNGLLVNATEHPSRVHAGYNELSVDWTINTGQRLFVKWDSDVFDLYQASEFWEKALIQDGTHQSTNVGYEGYSFYSIDGQVPFTYSYNDMTVQEQLANAKQKLAETSNQLRELSVAKPNIIRDNNGTAYRLVINNGTLGIQNATPNRVAIFGNSLISNTGGIGMAASDRYHDWYYLTSQYIKSHNPNAVINDRLNASTWEQAETSADRQSIFENTIKPQLSADTDLVILQLGDNVNTAARQATIEQDAEALIQDIKQVSPHAQIYWLASWFGNPELIAKLHDACLATGATHIDISDLNTKENQSSIGATRTGLDGKSWQVVNPGAAAHPGDAGMKAIADRLIANFDF